MENPSKRQRSDLKEKTKWLNPTQRGSQVTRPDPKFSKDESTRIGPSLTDEIFHDIKLLNS